MDEITTPARTNPESTPPSKPSRKTELRPARPFQPLLVKAWNLFSIGGRASKPLLPEDVIQAAINRSRVSDFGDKAFLEGFSTFLSSLGQSAAFHPFGRFYVRQMVIAMLVHRLLLAKLWTRRPEILDLPISRPIFILGLPRTGTTLLFNLLAQDPAHRFMRNWESFISQVPPPGTYPEAMDPRKRQAAWMLRFQRYLMPDVDRVHAFIADGPEECTPILMQSFATQAFVGGFDAPDYSAWLDHADRAPTYRHHRRVLQTLQWKYPGQRWILKSPDHLAAVDAILRVYPDACFVHIHRDPVKAVTSWASLNLVYRGVYYPQIDRRTLGEQVLTRLSNDMQRYLKERAAHASALFHDLSYAALMKHPIEAVRQLYAAVGEEITAATEDRMRVFLAAHPQHQHGIHSYAPEDFGLTAAVARSRFMDYLEAFEDPFLLPRH